MRLAVFDDRGREVALLVDNTLPPGRHEAVFDALGLPSGVYFCRLVAGDFAQTRPTTLFE